jgi:glycosyltransferase involved in cell wall biosynthesis
LIGETVENLLAQDHPGFEHIVVDGGSTDGTLEVLSRYPHLRVISEPDRGIFDAINKGIRAARGEIIGIVNTDDLLPPRTLQRVEAAFEESGADMVAGKAGYFTSVGDRGPEVLSEIEELAAPRLTLRNFAWELVMLEARFLKTGVFERVGLFDPGFTVGGALDFVLRLALANVTARYVDDVVYLYRIHPGSLTNAASGGGVRGTAAPLYEQHLTVLERFLRDRRLPEAARRTIRGWHSVQAGRAISVALVERQPGALMRTIRRGWRYDPAFPLFLGRYYGARLSRLGKLRT